MIISIIAAMDRDWTIGNKGRLPWDRIPADMERFRKLTVGQSVVMGRRTFESIGHALPDRDNIVLSCNEGYDAEGCAVVRSIDAALLYIPWYKELVVIGGGQIYEQFLPLADYMYLTYVEGEFGGDTFFPFFHLGDWKMIDRKSIGKSKESPFNLVFVKFQRRGSRSPVRLIRRIWGFLFLCSFSCDNIDESNA